MLPKCSHSGCGGGRDLRVIDSVADQERLIAALLSRKYPNLVVKSEILPGGFRRSVPQLNFSRSMRYLF